LEQVHVRGKICRGLRLELVAGLGIALAIPALALAAESSQGQTTQTTLSAVTRDQNGRTQATATVAVIGEDGLPAAGAIVLEDHGKQLSGAALNAQGQAKVVLALPAGNHLLRAVYIGDASHLASASQPAAVQAQSAATTTPDFAPPVLSPAALSLTAGKAGSAIVTIVPENNAALTSPMFVTLSCSGLPDQATCAFTPQSVEILATTPASCAAGSPAASCPPTTSMVIGTQAASTASITPVSRRNASPVAWAILFPGVLALGGLAWGSRRRRWLNRLSLVALVGLVTALGTTACNPRYNYEHHGPPTNPATPSGTYTVTVTAQSSNGVTAITHSSTLALTVN
jgi:hypothetical protein